MDISKQYIPPDDPDNGFYFAYLSKINYDVEGNLADILFEFVPERFVKLLSYNVTLSDKIPVWMFHTYHGEVNKNTANLHDLDTKAILALFNLKSIENFAEGSWYYIYLNRGEGKNQPVRGTIYDPDIDIGKGKEYGEWYIGNDPGQQPKLVLLPSWDPKESKLVLIAPSKDIFIKKPDDTGISDDDTRAPDDNDQRSDDEYPIKKPDDTGISDDGTRAPDDNDQRSDDEDPVKFTLDSNSDIINDGRSSSEEVRPGKRARPIDPASSGDIEETLGNLSKRRCPLVKVVKPDYQLASVGVMDVGMGNCNMIINPEGRVIAYYDVGYPLDFYRSTLPDTMVRIPVGPPFFPPGGGPIFATDDNPINIILSHWDWDHWRLGYIAGMFNGNYIWNVRDAPLSPTAINFFNSIAADKKKIVPYNTYVDGIKLYLTDPQGLSPNALMNNTGIAVRVNNGSDANGHLKYILSTGDANFNTLPQAALDGLDGIIAVHHGSSAHGAADNLPHPVMGDQGKIAYSYGVKQDGTHAYGFPTVAAIRNYRLARWTVERSTAEGPNLNRDPDRHNRGNILLGTRTPSITGTAFSIFNTGMILNDGDLNGPNNQ